MPGITNVLKWLVPVWAAIGAIAAGQVTYQIAGTGSDGSKLAGTATITPAAPAPTNNAPTTAPTPVVATSNPPVNGAAITVTNPAGPIYPLEGVFVNCHASAYTPEQLLTASILWNFGDGSGQYNALKGFNAAHSYANPGTYTISLTITLPNGSVSTATTPVTIVADNRPVIQIASGQLIGFFNSNTKYLLQSGGTWNFGGSGGAMSVARLQHVYVGSYGSGAQPILYCTAPQTVLNAVASDQSSAGIVVQGLTFDSNKALVSQGNASYSAISPVSSGGITMLNDTFLNLQEDVYCQNQCSNVLVQNCSSPAADDLVQYFCYDVGTEIVLLGNSCNGSQIQAIFRVVAWQPNQPTDVLVAYNNFSKVPDTNGKTAFTLQDGEFIYAYQNTVPLNGSPGVNGGNPFKTGPYTNLQYVVIDSNTSTNGSDLIGGASQHVVVENNVISIASAQGIQVNNDVPNVGQTNDLRLLNNTVVSTGSSASFATISNPSGTGIVQSGNWFSDPNATISGVSGLENFQSGNLNGFTTISNNLWPSVNPTNIAWPGGGVLFLLNNGSVATDYLTPAQWEQQPLGNGGKPTGDVYENVSLGSTYQATVNGQTYGANLPVPSASNGNKGN